MKKIIGILSVMFLLLSVSYAGAVTIDFESFAAGTTVSGAGVFDDFVLSAGADSVITAAANPGPDFTGTMAAQGSPFTHRSPFRVDFLISGVDSFSVVMGDYNADADNLFVRAYDSANNLLDEELFALASSVYGGPTMSVSGTNIAYVLFGSTGTYLNSVYFDNVSYNSVPEPATLLLFGLGLVGLAGLRRKVK